MMDHRNDTKRQSESTMVSADRRESETTIAETENQHGMPSKSELQEHSTTEASKPPSEFLEGWRLYVVSMGLMLSLICSGLDRSIVAVATPAITSEFNSLQDVGWYGSAYLLTMCCFQLPVGKLFKELSMKYVFLATLVIFEVGSVICAVAPSSLVLIVGRAVAGVGGAGIIGGSLIVIGSAVEPSKRPSFLAVFGATANLAQAFGPLIGGALVEGASWRWCFWINLPIGGVTAAVILFSLRLPPPPPRPRGKNWISSTIMLLNKLDALSTATLVPSIVCLLLVLQWGGTTYPWSNWRCILLFCVFGISFLVWLYMQYRRGDSATVPPRLLKQRSIVFGSIYTMAAFGSSMVMLYYLPIWFQAVRGDSALKAGVDLCPLMLSWAFLLIISAQLTVRTGYFVPQMIAATVVMSITTGLITMYDLNTSTAFWLVTLFFYGFGIGLGAQQPLIAAQSLLKGTDITLGTSLIMFLQVLSGTIMVSVGQNVFSQRIIPNLATTAPDVDPQIVLAAGNEDLASKMAKIYPSETVHNILVAYNKSIQYVFVFALALTCLTVIGSLGMEWKNVKKLNDEQLGEKRENEKSSPASRERANESDSTTDDYSEKKHNTTESENTNSKVGGAERKSQSESRNLLARIVAVVRPRYR